MSGPKWHDPEAIRKLGDEIAHAADSLGSFGGILMDPPLVLTAEDWGHTGDNQQLKATYSSLREQVKEIMDDSWRAFQHAQHQLYSAANEYAESEDEKLDMLGEKGTSMDYIRREYGYGG